MLSNNLTDLLQIKYPIIQAPMAGGITTTDLVISVANAGGLGMIGAGYMGIEQLRSQIRDVKKHTQNFGVNLFVPEEFSAKSSEIELANKSLQPIREKLNVSEEHTILPTYEKTLENFHEQINVLLEEQVRVCSFTFGVPDQSLISKLKERNIIVVGTATTVKEAMEIEQIKMDAVVVQGSEAGGHRGNYKSETADSLIGLMSLIPQVVDKVKIPVIAAGGIMDERGLVASLILGAKAVQMGTAFLTTKESGANEIHKNEILQTTEDEIVLTKSFSGKYARGIKNDFISYMEKDEEELPPFPVQNRLTQSIRKVASLEKNKEYMSLWSGQSPRLATNKTATQLIETIMKKATELL